MSEHHVYTNTNYVLRTISKRYKELGDWKYLSILIFKDKNSLTIADAPESFEELEGLLKGYDKVYSFHEVETARHGEVGFDIILE